jgi:hypothetical protein
LFNDCLTEVIDGDCVLNNGDIKDCELSNTNNCVNTDEFFDANSFNNNDFKDCEYNITNICVNTDKFYDKSCDVITDNISFDVDCVFELPVSSAADIRGEVACQAALHEADLAFSNGNDMSLDIIDDSNITFNCTYKNDDVYIHDVAPNCTNDYEYNIDMCTYNDDSHECKQFKVDHGSHGYNSGLVSPVAGEGVRFSSRLDSASVNQPSNTPVINYPDYSQIMRCLDSTDVNLVQDLVQVPVFGLDSNQVFQIQSTFGFVPLGELPVVAGPPGPTININVAI